MRDDIMKLQKVMNTGEGKFVGKHKIILNVKIMIIISCEV